MLKRIVVTFAVAGFIGAVLPTSSQAQATIFAGGGITVPTSDFGDYADTGWMASAGVLIPVGPMGLHVGAEGFYGQNNHSDIDGDKTNPYGAMALVEYGFQTGGNITPYVFGGAGVLVHKYSSDTFDNESDTKFGYEFGAGLDFGVSDNVGVWVDGRYMGSEFTKFFAVQAGLGFGVGG